jgi:Putative esterase
MSRLSEKTGINRIAAITRNGFGLSLLLLIVSCGGGGADKATASSLKGRITANTMVPSNNSRANYQISVYLPADHATTTDNLPAIDALDGGVDNGDRFVRMATITEEQGVRAVLIAIGGYARRETDYRLPGASNFYAFVTTALIPFIESRDRIDPGTRTLAGHSYGGFFAVVALLKDRPDPGFFANFISQDIATADQEAPLFEMEQQLFTASAGNLPGTTLILSDDTLGNDVSIEAVYQRFLVRNYQGLKLQRIPAYSLGHQEMFEPSFRDSIRLLFES